MTLASTSDLIVEAIENRCAVMAFNAITLEHAEGIALGVERAGAAALIQISENTVRFHGGALAPITAACAQIATASAAPLALHLDHIQDSALLDEVVATAPALGVTSVMIDAAHLGADENVGQTAAFVQRARGAGLYVEAELGQVGGRTAASSEPTSPVRAPIPARRRRSRRGRAWMLWLWRWAARTR